MRIWRHATVLPGYAWMPMQPGDVPSTHADVDDLMEATGFSPSTPIEVGIAKFVDWYRDYYKGSRSLSEEEG